MIKKLLLCTAMCTSTVALAEQATNDDNNSCKMILCLQEEAFRESEITKQCIDAQKNFFRIIKKKHGKISIPRTVNKRRDHLEQCEGARDKDIVRIIEIWGHVIDPRDAYK